MLNNFDDSPSIEVCSSNKNTNDLTNCKILSISVNGNGNGTNAEKVDFTFNQETYLPTKLKVNVKKSVRPTVDLISSNAYRDTLPKTKKKNEDCQYIYCRKCWFKDYKAGESGLQRQLHTLCISEVALGQFTVGTVRRKKIKLKT